MTISRTHVDMKSIYAARRQRLMQAMGENSIAVLPANPVAHRTADMDYPYCQESNFYYLTGFPERQSVIVLIPGRPEGEFILFNLPSDPVKEAWTGKRAGQQGAVEQFGADQSYSIDEFATRLPALLGANTKVYFPITDQSVDKAVKELLLANLVNKNSDIQRGFRSGFSIIDCASIIHSMREVKEQVEIELIRQAVAISCAGHLSAMQHCAPGKFEYELEAKLAQKFTARGSRAVAYDNIVGSGPNTCTLHYTENDREIQDGELVLIDAGADFQYYKSDITRTFPANGKFTPEQKKIYEIVLAAQLAAIAVIAPGATCSQVSEVVARVITQGLLDVGLLTGDLEQLIKNQAYKPFYMHSPGHWLGLDTHDVGRYMDNVSHREVTMKPNMVLTIEPGIYIAATHQDVPEKWRNIGVRIEDVVLVTESGCEVLSANLPKAVDEIESVMADAKQRVQFKALQKRFLFFAASPGGVDAESLEQAVSKPNHQGW